MNSKHITNEQFEKAIGNIDNSKIMSNVISKNGFSNLMSQEEVESCKMIALWKALQHWRPELGKKFTSYLYQKVYWECRKYIAKQKAKKIPIAIIDHFPKFIAEDKSLEMEEIIDILPGDLPVVIRQRVFDKMTLKEIGNSNGYSHETARRKINRAIKEICKLCK